MRALTVRQPWAWAIAEGHKDIENRSWYPRLEPGEVLAIHAGCAAPDWDDVERVTRLVGGRGAVPQEYDRGCVVAVVRYGRAVESARSKWFSGPVGWVLLGATALRSPVPCKGQLGLWCLPPGVERSVRRALSHHLARKSRAGSRGAVRARGRG